jgi:rhodanese-related sulfurtransferase
MFTDSQESLSQSHSNAKSPSEVATEFQIILAAARETAQRAGLRYAGDISPQDAWQLFSSGFALLIDVRTPEELKFVGFVPESLHVAWMTGVNFLKNQNFLRELEIKASRDDVILFLCRSGKRSVAAAEAVTKVGFRNAFNILEGFEGDMENGKRGIYCGWRSHDLPWIQD